MRSHCMWSGGGVRHGRKETRKMALHKKKKKTLALPFLPLCEFSLAKTRRWQVFRQDVKSTFAFGCSNLFVLLARLPKRGGAYVVDYKICFVLVYFGGGGGGGGGVNGSIKRKKKKKKKSLTLVCLYMFQADNLIFKDRKLNIGPAVRKQVGMNEWFKK